MRKIMEAKRFHDSPIHRDIPGFPHMPKLDEQVRNAQRLDGEVSRSLLSDGTIPPAIFIEHNTTVEISVSPSNPES